MTNQQGRLRSPPLLGFRQQPAPQSDRRPHDQTCLVIHHRTICSQVCSLIYSMHPNLLSIPKELRLRTYDFALNHPRQSVRVFCNYQSEQVLLNPSEISRPVPFKPSCIALLLVCQQITSEIRSQIENNPSLALIPRQVAGSPTDERCLWSPLSTYMESFASHQAAVGLRTVLMPADLLEIAIGMLPWGKRSLHTIFPTITLLIIYFPTLFRQFYEKRWAGRTQEQIEIAKRHYISHRSERYGSRAGLKLNSVLTAPDRQFVVKDVGFVARDTVSPSFLRREVLMV